MPGALNIYGSAWRGRVMRARSLLICICALRSAWQKPYQKLERIVKSRADVLFSNFLVFISNFLVIYLVLDMQVNIKITC